MATLSDYIGVKTLDETTWNGFVRMLATSIGALSDRLVGQEEVVAGVVARGLGIIAEQIEPLVAEASDDADAVAAARATAGDLLAEIADRARQIGLVFAASSASSIEISGTRKVFQVAEADRPAFVALPWLAIAREGDWGTGFVARLVDYDRDTGDLTVDPVSVRGAGTWTSWRIGPVATTDDLEALRVSVADDRAVVAADRIVVESVRDDVVARLAASQAGRVWYAWQHGVEPSSPGAPVYVDAAFDAMIAAAVAAGVGRIMFAPGMHFLAAPHILPRSIAYEGLGRLPNWRAGPSDPAHLPDLTSENCTVFVACDVGAKQQTLDYVTASVQCGYDRENPEPQADPKFQSFRLLDLTAEDAVGASRATLRPFSALLTFEEGWGRCQIENIRVVSSCPDPDLGEVQGLGGYARGDVVLPWADWDFGLFMTNAWGRRLIGCQIVGYWRYGAILSYDGFKDWSLASGGTPYAEAGLARDGVFQGGVVMRAPDFWPVVAVGVDAISVRWTPSHRFPTSGTIYVTGGDTLSGAVPVTYTGLTYDGETDRLVFGGCSANAAVVGSKVTQAMVGGHSHTHFVDCVIVDFAHAAALDDASPDLDAVGLPGRPGYRAAIEMSGAPMRAVKFTNVPSPVVGALMAHFGAATDVLFDGDCYSEGRPFKLTIAGGWSAVRGALFIAGPRAAAASEVGSAGRVSIAAPGRAWNTGINRVPLMPARSGARFETMTDVHNALSRVADDIWPESSTGELLVETLLDKNYRVIRRRTGGDQTLIYGRTVTGIDYLELLSGMLVLKSGVSIYPGADNLYDCGSASRRMKQYFAGTATIYTSDEREKQDIEPIPDAVLDAWGDVEWQQFRFVGRLRLHAGLVAQQVDAAFAARGLDGRAYGVLCFDAWEDDWDEVVGADGSVERVLVTPAGNRWGIRYEEAAALEAAWHRREIARLSARLDQISAAS